MLLGGRLSLRELGCEGIGPSVIKDAEKVAGALSRYAKI